MRVRARCAAAGIASAGLLAIGLAAPQALLAQAVAPQAAPQDVAPQAVPPAEPAVAPAPVAPAPAPATAPSTFVPDPPPAGAAPAPVEPEAVQNESQPATATPRHRHRHRHRRRARERTSDRARSGGDGKLDPALQDALRAIGPLNVPSFFIDTFAVPPFLLPIYQAAGIEYDVPWEVLAAINEIETDYGRNLNLSTAGAMGWMQFLPSTWRQYAIDASGDGRKDPYNPVDAIFAAARYLKAAGGGQHLSAAIFAYNHADWYVRSVLKRAQLLAGLPSDLVSALSGLAQGRPPVVGRARTVGRRGGHARTLSLATRAKAPVVAATDGEIVGIGHSRRLGSFIRLRDAYGNTYTYAGLGRFARRYPMVGAATKPAGARSPEHDAAPTAPATAGAQRHGRGAASTSASATGSPPATPLGSSSASALASSGPAARPARTPRRAPSRAAARQRARAALRAPSPRPADVAPVAPASWPPAPALARLDRAASIWTARRTAQRPARSERARPPAQLNAYDRRLLGHVGGRHVRYRPLREGSRVVAGTVLARAGTTPSAERGGRLRLEIRPAGRGAPRIDPRPIVAGWKLLRASQPTVTDEPTIGQIVLLGKQALERRVLDDRRIEIYRCGRDDIRAGRIDRRALITLELLAVSGLHPTVSSLACGHGLRTSSGRVSEHVSGNAVDISAINGVPILGHQGPGSITETVIRRLLSLQGTVKPHQIISLMTFDGADNTLSLPDHDDHIHVGFAPERTPGSLAARQFDGVLEPRQWAALMKRLSRIGNPEVLSTPSRDAVRTRRKPR